MIDPISDSRQTLTFCDYEGRVENVLRDLTG